jgi:putative polyketide hydroxylase
MTGTERVPVLIAGGGPVGLAAALELARHGVPSLVLERHAGTTWHPKARNVNTRTMEIARGWGATAHGELRAANLPPGWTDHVVYTTTLAGEEVGRVRTQGFSGPGLDISPEVPLLSSQDVIEPILVRAVEATGLAQVRFGHEVADVDDAVGAGRADSVRVAVVERASGRKYVVRADYLIAADGAASPVRRRLGIELDGPQGIGHFVNVYFRADLRRWTAHRPAVLYWVAGPHTRGVFQPLDGQDRWLCQIAYDGTAASRTRYTPQRCAQWIRAAVGDKRVTPEILSVGTWTMNATVARRLVHGRVLLAGDAAHQLPPTGGFGLNTGIQGVHNLAWKLALVLAGRAAPGLLDTYDTERRAVARVNADRSLDNSRMVDRIAAATTRGGPDPAQVVARAHRYGNFLGMELGFAYESAAVVPDGTSAPVVDDPVENYLPVGRPGHRAPHAWFDDGRSTLDLFGTGFTVLAAGAGGWEAAARDAGAERRMSVAHHMLGPNEKWARLYEVNTGGAVLVRPDGHVAYRCASAVDDPAHHLSHALRQILDE